MEGRARPRRRPCDGRRLLEALRIVAILVQPAMPDAAQAVWERIGMTGQVGDQRLPDAAAWGQYAGAGT